MNSYTESYFSEIKCIIDLLDVSKIERVVDLIEKLKKDKGRLFILGVGGGAGNASHAVNDFRKIAEIEAYSPSDNVSELTARANDEGWESTYANWLRVSHLNQNDLIFVFSVGGGDPKKRISINIVTALKYAVVVGTPICGVVGRDGGVTKTVASECIIVPTINPQNVTPYTESIQSLIWHLIVSHPRIKTNETKWESLTR